MNAKNKKLISETIENVDKIEDLVITMLHTMNGRGMLDNDKDLYFLTDMLSITRSYGNLLEDLMNIEDKPS